MKIDRNLNNSSILALESNGWYVFRPFFMQGEFELIVREILSYETIWKAWNNKWKSAFWEQKCSSFVNGNLQVAREMKFDAFHVSRKSTRNRRPIKLRAKTISELVHRSDRD